MCPAQWHTVTFSSTSTERPPSGAASPGGHNVHSPALYSFSSRMSNSEMQRRLLVIIACNGTLFSGIYICCYLLSVRRFQKSRSSKRIRNLSELRSAAWTTRICDGGMSDPGTEGMPTMLPGTFAIGIRGNACRALRQADVSREQWVCATILTWKRASR